MEGRSVIEVKERKTNNKVNKTYRSNKRTAIVCDFEEHSGHAVIDVIRVIASLLSIGIDVCSQSIHSRGTHLRKSKIIQSSLFITYKHRELAKMQHR